MFPWRQFTVWLGLLFSVAGGNVAPPAAAEGTQGPPTVRVVVDWRTGLALYGMDPVAYFSGGKALAGLPEFELAHGGAVWRFRNAGNRAAFLADPDVYTPRFAGRDPMVVARGVATAGSPLVWLLSDQRLYLFHAPESRDAFNVDPSRALAAAEGQWPAVMLTLDPASLMPALLMPALLTPALLTPALKAGAGASEQQSGRPPQ